MTHAVPRNIISRWQQHHVQAQQHVVINNKMMDEGGEGEEGGMQSWTIIAGPHFSAVNGG
jgi:hypothetical protein